MAGVRAQRRQEKTAQILEVATQILTSEGLEALTVQRLASALSWTPGAMYRYFPSKEAVLVAMQVQILAEMEGMMERAWSRLGGRAEVCALPPGSGALLKVQGACRVYGSLPRVMPERFRLMAITIGDPKTFVQAEQMRPALEATEALLRPVGALLAEAAALGALRPGDARRRVVELWAVTHGATSIQKFARLGDSVVWAQGLIGSAVGAMLCGWGASPEQIAGLEALLEALYPGDTLSEDEAQEVV